MNVTSSKGVETSSKLCNIKSGTSTFTRLKLGVKLMWTARCRAKINIWNWALKTTFYFTKSSFDTKSSEPPRQISVFFWPTLSKYRTESCPPSRKRRGWYCENYQPPLAMILLLFDFLHNLTSCPSYSEILPRTLLFQLSSIQDLRL